MRPNIGGIVASPSDHDFVDEEEMEGPTYSMSSSCVPLGHFPIKTDVHCHDGPKAYREVYMRAL